MIFDAGQRVDWPFVPAAQSPHQAAEVYVDSQLPDAVIRLNPEIAAHRKPAYSGVYNLRAISLAFQNDRLVRSNEATPACHWVHRSRRGNCRNKHLCTRCSRLLQNLCWRSCRTVRRRCVSRYYVLISSVQKQLENERIRAQEILWTDTLLKNHCDPGRHQREPTA